MRLFSLAISMLILLGCKKQMEIGCMDENALNFNPNATADSGCVYEILPDEFNPSVIPKNGLILWLPLDGDATDASGFEQHGENENSRVYPTTDRFEIPNMAMNFNGYDSRITIRQASLADSCEEITISVWFNTTNSGSNQTIVTKSGVDCEGAIGEMFTMRPDLAQFKLGNSWKGATPLEYPLGKWTNFVISYSEGEMRIYQNAQLIDKLVMNLNFNETFESCIKIGQHWDGDPQWFSGKIDDFAIWNRALSDAEIALIYNIKK